MEVCDSKRAGQFYLTLWLSRMVHSFPEGDTRLKHGPSKKKRNSLSHYIMGLKKLAQTVGWPFEDDIRINLIRHNSSHIFWARNCWHKVPSPVTTTLFVLELLAIKRRPFPLWWTSEAEIERQCFGSVWQMTWNCKTCSANLFPFRKMLSFGICS